MTTKKTDNSKFKGGRFSAGPTYKCRDCGKTTRETGMDESSVELCARCYEQAGIENELSDGHIDEAQHEAAAEAIEAKYSAKQKKAKGDKGPALLSKLINLEGAARESKPTDAEVEGTLAALRSGPKTKPSRKTKAGLKNLAAVADAAIAKAPKLPKGIGGKTRVLGVPLKAPKAKRKVPAKINGSSVECCAATDCYEYATADGVFCPAHLAEQRAASKKADAAIGRLKVGKAFNAAGEKVAVSVPEKESKSALVAKLEASEKKANAKRVSKAKAQKVADKVGAEITASLNSMAGRELVASLGKPAAETLVKDALEAKGGLVSAANDVSERDVRRSAPKAKRAKKAPAAPPADAPRFGRASTRDATLEVMTTLLSSGWTVAAVTRALGMPSAGPVHNWKMGVHGAGEARLEVLRSLVGTQPTAKERATVGAIKAPAAATKAAKVSKRTPAEDRRQLILELQSQLKALLAAESK